jgi:AcrR family transcriptional regulator
VCLNDQVATRRSPRRRPDADGRRAELVEAAGRVVARDGIAAATTRRIAEEAGLPQGLVHYWFASKDELLEEVIMTLLRQFQEATEAIPAGAASPDQGDAQPGDPGDPGDADPAQYVREAFRAAFGVVEADDRGNQLATYELTTWALRTPQMRDLARQQYAAYRSTAAAVAAPWLAGHGRDFPGDAGALARLVAVLFDGTVLAWLADPEGTRPDDIFSLVSEMLASYVRERQAPPAG